jgi:hypothetical protein
VWVFRCTAVLWDATTPSQRSSTPSSLNCIVD